MTIAEAITELRHLQSSLDPEDRQSMLSYTRP